MSHVEFTMQGKENLIQTMAATGDVAFDSTEGADSRSLQTQSLLVKFGQGKQPGKARVETAETLAPGTIVSKAAGDSTELRAKKFVTQFNAAGQSGKTCLDIPGCEIRRQSAAGAPQNSSATELVATFAPGGDWDTRGRKRKREIPAGRSPGQRGAGAHGARHRHDHYGRVAGLVGRDQPDHGVERGDRSEVWRHSSDGRGGFHVQRGGTSARRANRCAGQTSAQNTPMTLGTGPGHVSAQTLTGSTTSGHVIYTGHARLWQGDSVLQANQIEVWRDEKKLVATGNVVAVFPQAAGTQLKTPGFAGAGRESRLDRRLTRTRRTGRRCGRSTRRC